MKQLSRAVADRLTLTIANLRLRETLRDLSIHDPLTNLYNRRFMQEALERELSRAVRRSQAVSLIMMDIDHFKNFNDSYGHAKGDEILKMLADHFVKNIRKEDFACRFGGEEFLIIMPDSTPAQALARAEELRLGISKMQVPVEGSEAQSITVSVGVAGYPHNGDTITEVMEAADFALYRAKAKGRNCVVQARG